jgi:hypothetical protein
MLASRLVDCRVAGVVLERFGFLCFAILGGGKACWCRGKAVLVQLFVRCESRVEALLAIRGSIRLCLSAVSVDRGTRSLVVRDVWRLWLMFFQGILGDDEGLGAVVKARRGGDNALVRRLGGDCRLMLCVVKALGGGDDAKGFNDGSDEAVDWLCVVKALGGGDDAKGFNDGSDEAVDWLCVVKALGGGDDAKGVASTARR